MMVPFTDRPAAGEGEDDPVASWRLEQLSSLGFDESQAFLLAHSELDLHLLRTLLGRKCPVELAVRIAL
jgi:hypothetical protein